MKRALYLAPIAAVAGLLIWAFSVRNAPPELRFTRIQTGRLVDTLITNGKVEPIEWASVRAERGGTLTRLLVERGQTVAAGAIVAEQDAAELTSSLRAAEARVAQVAADQDNVKGGGRAGELADIAGQIAKLGLDKQSIDAELAATERLVRQKAATAYEANALKERSAQIAQQVRSLESRRAALVTPGDRAGLDAKLREAQAAVESSRQRVNQGLLRSPLGGTVYQLDPRPGSYLNPGDLVANIGRIDTLKVTVYVDEPELGRVGKGMRASITWDAKPDRKWEGTVEKLPVQIVPLGTRQVGEVVVLIENPGQELPPGANINAAIRSRMVENALLLPKETLRRENSVSGVYVLEGTKLAWRPVKTGVSNVTEVQVLEGLKAGDLVMLPSDISVRPGMEVKQPSESASR